MRYIGPKITVIVIEAESRAKALPHHLHPERAGLFGRQLAFFTRFVKAAFEIVEGNLPYHGVQHVLHFARQKRTARVRIFLAGQQ